MNTLVMEGNAVYCPLGKVQAGSGKMPASCVSRASFATDCTFNFVQLHCPLVDVQIPCDLLVESSPHNMRKHFEFAFGERVEAGA
jgi:hypothetical protein